MSDLAKIKEVQRITSAGIVACKSALQLADGDLFEAVASLLSYDDAKLMRSELLSRQCASGDRLSEEQAFVDRLIERLEPERELIESAAEWRPGTVYQDGLWMRFCDSFTFAYLSDPNVRQQIALDQSNEANRFWDIVCRDMRQRKRFDLNSDSITIGTDRYLYVTLPVIRAWSDAIAVVCEQTNPSTPPRVFQVFSLHSDAKIAGLEIVEMLYRRDDLILGNSSSIKLDNSCTSELIVKSISSIANA